MLKTITLLGSVALIHALGLAVLGQGSGSIKGTVRVASGAPVPGVTVVVTNQVTGKWKRMRSSLDGLYSFRLVAGAFRVRLDNSEVNPYYMAAWLGLLVTSLNLMPVGQLDGGHGTFALFGLQAHKWIGRIAFVTMAVLALLGWFWHASPSGFLYTVLLAIMLKVRHPQPGQMEPLGSARIWIAILTLVVFVLCFWPFPITIT